MLSKLLINGRSAPAAKIRNLFEQPFRPVALALSIPVTVTGAFADCGVEATDASLRAVMPSSSTAAIYLTLSNSCPSGDRLIGVSTEAAEHAALHETTVSDGVSQMRHVAGGIPIAGGEDLVLEPGGAHIMLMGISGGLQDAKTVEIGLEFSNSAPISLTIPVEYSSQ